jgi:serine/threonine protein kinase
MENEIGNFTFEPPLDSYIPRSIRRAHHKGSDILVAIRVIPKTSVPTAEARSHLSDEISFFKQLDHPFILGFFQCIETDLAFHIVTEHGEHGKISDFLRCHGRVTEDEARRLFAQLVQVLEYLHCSHQPNHSYIDWENILLDRNNNLRVIVRLFKEGVDKPLNVLSPAYTAPEVVRGGHFTTATDVWSAGILLYSILVGMQPFESEQRQLLWQHIVWADAYFPWFLTTEAIDLLNRLIRKDPEQRFSIGMIISHSWFRGEYRAWVKGEIASGDNNSTVDRICRRLRVTKQIGRHGSSTNASERSAQVQV